jgi:hypothetical protein
MGNRRLHALADRIERAAQEREGRSREPTKPHGDRGHG